MEIFGWFGEGHKEVYNRYMTSVRETGSVLEVGCLLGKSTHYLASLLKDKNISLHCCDLWDSTTASSVKKNCIMLEEKYGRDLIPEFLKNTKEFNFIKAYKMSSKKFFESLESNVKFDRIYLDGSHEYDFVKSDIIYSLKHIADDGIIAGDDYANGCPGVIRAVNEIFGDSTETNAFPRQWVFNVGKNKNLYFQLLKKYNNWKVK